MSPESDIERFRVIVRRSMLIERQGSVLMVDPGIYDAVFLCEMLGADHYRDAVASGQLVVIATGDSHG